MKKILRFFRKKAVRYTAIILLVLIALIAYLVHRHYAKTYTFVSVTQGSIAETVSVTGNTTPIQSVSLGFGNSGTVAHIYSSIGQRVASGTLLATLDTGDLFAQEKQAQANVDTQNAKLDGLKAGARPEDVQVSEAQLSKAKQDLANMYASVSTTLSGSYNYSVDAIYNQLNAFFANGDTNPQLNFTSSDSQAVIDATSKRVKVGQELAKWQQELSSLNTSSDATTLDSALQNGTSHLAVVSDFLSNIARLANTALSVPPGVSTIAALKGYVASAVSDANTAQTNLNTASQNIASQKLTVEQLQAALDLKKAGASAQDISAQQAQVAQAEASVESIQAKIRNSEIIAPQRGVITQFDAKVGQTASPSTPLISIISDNSFEIDATVSEIDVGKISLNNKVSMTIDAFPHETFTGSVFYIDPAQTNTAGVVGYKIKVAFDKPDSRMKSGLTVNLDIETRHKDAALILPQYAILQDDSGTFVEVLENNVTKQIPVTLGIADQEGNVEVTSGVTAGEQVLNIGLK